MSTKNMFTVEYNDKDECVELHFNKNGAMRMIDILNQCIKLSRNEHYNLFTPSWGGNELSEEKQNTDDTCILINHLKIMFWD